MKLFRSIIFVLVGIAMMGIPAFAQHGVQFVRPDSIIDMRTDDGAALVRGQWKYGDARIVEVDRRNPGPDLKPTGAPNRTHDIDPKAGASNFDDSNWEAITASSLHSCKALIIGLS